MKRWRKGGRLLFEGLRNERKIYVELFCGYITLFPNFLTFRIFIFSLPNLVEAAFITDNCVFPQTIDYCDGAGIKFLTFGIIHKAYSTLIL